MQTKQNVNIQYFSVLRVFKKKKKKLKWLNISRPGISRWETGVSLVLTLTKLTIWVDISFQSPLNKTKNIIF